MTPVSTADISILVHPTILYQQVLSFSLYHPIPLEIKTWKDLVLHLLLSSNPGSLGIKLCPNQGPQLKIQENVRGSNYSDNK